MPEVAQAARGPAPRRGAEENRCSVPAQHASGDRVQLFDEIGIAVGGVCDQREFKRAVRPDRAGFVLEGNSRSVRATTALAFWAFSPITLITEATSTAS